MFRNADADASTGNFAIMDSLVDPSQAGAAEIRAGIEREEAADAIKRRARRSDMPDVLVITIKPVNTHEHVSCEEAQSTGVYTTSSIQAMSDHRTWYCKASDSSVSLNRGQSVWQLHNRAGKLVAKAQPKMVEHRPVVAPPHDVEWAPAAPERFTVTVVGECNETHEMQVDWSRRMALLQRVYRFREGTLSHTTRPDMTEMVDRIRNFCSGTALQRLIRFKRAGTRISTFIHSIRKLQTMQRDWIKQRNWRMRALFERWVEDDKVERERLSVKLRKTIKANSQLKTDVARQLSVIDGTTAMQRKAAIVKLYKVRLDAERSAARLSARGVIACFRTGAMSRVLSDDPDTLGQLVVDARGTLMRLNEEWARRRADAAINGAHLAAPAPVAAAADVVDGVKLTDDEFRWTMRFLDWMPPAPVRRPSTGSASASGRRRSSLGVGTPVVPTAGLRHVPTPPPPIDVRMAVDDVSPMPSPVPPSAAPVGGEFVAFAGSVHSESGVGGLLGERERKRSARPLPRVWSGQGSPMGSPTGSSNGSRSASLFAATPPPLSPRTPGSTAPTMGNVSPRNAARRMSVGVRGGSASPAPPTPRSSLGASLDERLSDMFAQRPPRAGSMKVSTPKGFAASRSASPRPAAESAPVAVVPPFRTCRSASMDPTAHGAGRSAARIQSQQRGGVPPRRLSIQPLLEPQRA